MIRTKNFNPNTDPKLLCTCGHVDCDKRSVDQYSLDRLQCIRAEINQALNVTSGGRCANHPSEVRKQKAGDHQKCRAVDIACNDELLETKLKVLAGRHGATRVAGGAYCGFVHIAWTKTINMSVPTWSYK